jgi:hypothetical protein
MASARRNRNSPDFGQEEGSRFRLVVLGVQKGDGLLQLHTPRRVLPLVRVPKGWTQTQPAGRLPSSTLRADNCLSARTRPHLGVSSVVVSGSVRLGEDQAGLPHLPHRFLRKGSVVPAWSSGLIRFQWAGPPPDSLKTGSVMTGWTLAAPLPGGGRSGSRTRYRFAEEADRSVQTQTTGEWIEVC